MPRERRAAAPQHRGQERRLGVALGARAAPGARPALPGLGRLDARRPRRPAAHARMRSAARSRSRARAPSTSVQLLPPKPNEFVITRGAAPGRAVSPLPHQVQRRELRIALAVQACGGSASAPRSRRSSTSQQNAASIAPAAPSVWPTSGLVELHGQRACRTRARPRGTPSRRSAACRCRAGSGRRSRRARARRRRARRASPPRRPRRSGSGADMWCASLDSPTPSELDAARLAASPGTRAAPSPSVSPARFALHGLVTPLADRLERAEAVRGEPAQRVGRARDRPRRTRRARAASAPTRARARPTSTRSRACRRGRARRASRPRSPPSPPNSSWS